MTAVPRPVTKLTDEQRKLLAEAVTAAEKAKRSQQKADEITEAAWQKIIEGRTAGIPDEVLCDETGFSRATLNRRYGRRPD